MRARVNTKTEALQGIVVQYRETGQEWPATAKMIAGWALTNGLYQPSRKSVMDLLARDLSRAMREEYITDPQGRQVRRLHPRRVLGEMQQPTFEWDDITTAPPDHMHMSFQQRRQMILGDCSQLKTDVDSYNENYNSGAPIPMSYDFSEDLEEMQFSDIYPDFYEDEAN